MGSIPVLLTTSLRAAEAFWEIAAVDRTVLEMYNLAYVRMRTAVLFCKMRIQAFHYLSAAPCRQVY